MCNEAWRGESVELGTAGAWAASMQREPLYLGERTKQLISTQRKLYEKLLEELYKHQWTVH